MFLKMNAPAACLGCQAQTRKGGGFFHIKNPGKWNGLKLTTMGTIYQH